MPDNKDKKITLKWKGNLKCRIKPKTLGEAILTYMPSWMMRPEAQDYMNQTGKFSMEYKLNETKNREKHY